MTPYIEDMHLEPLLLHSMKEWCASIRQQSNYLWVCLLGLLILSTKAMAQDIQFSQFYAVPLYLNPAFAGGAHQDRVLLHQRLQWFKLDGNYTTSFASFDKYFEKYNSGLGLTFIRDSQGANVITSNEANLQYAYELHLSKEYTFRAGLQLGYVFRNLNYADLTFPHQYNNQGFSNSPSDYNLYGDASINYADVTSGGLFYSKKMWFGFSGHHLNRPSQGINRETSRLPAQFSFTAGYKIPLKHIKYMAYMEDEKDISISPTVHYKFQGQSDQLDLGFYGIYDRLMVGTWYRGIPFKKYQSNLPNNESLVFLAGFKLKTFSLSYSYDFTISSLSTVSTGGAHEFNLTYLRPKKKRHKKMKTIPCPSFYFH